MAVIEHLIEVRWRHCVHFTDYVFAPANPLLRDVLVGDNKGRPARVMVVVDDSLARARAALLSEIQDYFARWSELVLVGEPLLMPGGEAVKNDPQHVVVVHAAINERHIDRQSTVIAVGGGALLDMVGYAAATAHRWVRLIRIPTTTLSQADSGVGVKNGINAFGKKNFIGTFSVPFAVINDFEMLASLPSRDKRAGYIEAVKVACIRDPIFFRAIEQDAPKLRQFEPAAMERLIHRCAELHLNHIATSGDPFELGSARPLDFGHWAAHKLEQLSEFKIRHGEAVAVGIALDVIYSRRTGLLDTVSAGRILDLIESLGFDLYANELLNVDSKGDFLILKGLEEFREHLGGQLTITLLSAIGKGCEVHEMNEATVFDSIRELQTRQQERVLSSGPKSAVKPVLRR